MTIRINATRRSWSDEDDDRLKAMLADDKSVPEIATALECSGGAVRARKYLLGLRRHPLAPTHVGPNETRVALSNPQSLDRDRREEARNRMDLTGQIFGDPPPGYSALDRRMRRA